MSFVVRPATIDDAPVVVEFNQQMARESEGRELDPVLLARGVARVLEDPSRGLYFVAVEDSVLAGQIMVTREWSDWRDGWLWWIQSVYVRLEQRRRGVFSALYHHVEDAARSSGQVVGLRLYVERDNARAIATYRKLGMLETTYMVMVHERDPL